MKSNQSWQFSCEPKDLDIPRIVREAGKDARVIRLTVGTDIYTLVNQDWLNSTGDRIDWENDPQLYVGSDMPRPYVDYSYSEKDYLIRVPGHTDYRKWALIKGDEAGMYLHRSKVAVEVF